MAKKLASGLTEFQERACRELLIDPTDQAGAYKRAGSTAKYAALKSGSSRLFAMPEAQKFIKTLTDRRNEKVGVNVAWVLQRLVDEVEADISEIYDDDYNLLPLREWPEVFRKGLVAGIDVEEIYEGVGGKRKKVGEVRKIKLSDRLKRIELIGKHVDINAFREQHGVGNPDGSQIDVANDVEIARRLAFILTKGAKK